MNGGKRRETALHRHLLLLLGLQQLHRGRGLLTVAILVHAALRRQIRWTAEAPPRVLLEIRRPILLLLLPHSHSRHLLVHVHVLLLTMSG